MEKSAQTPTENSTATSSQQQICCGGKTRAGMKPQDPTEISMNIESAPAPTQGNSGCCCGHR